jgi:UDP-N-acetylglucosamine transferase subunit ALG13
MIFVTIGLTRPFDRLIGALDGLPDEELIVQCGDGSARPANGTAVSYLPFDEVVEHVRRARIVISHAGVGSVMVALAQGKRPIVVPRLARYDEAADDHQVPFARRLAREGVISLVEDTSTLVDVLLLQPPGESAPEQTEPELAVDLRAFLTSRLVPA